MDFWLVLILLGGVVLLGAGRTTPQNVLIHTTSKNDGGRATSQRVPIHTTPQKVTVHTTPQNDTGHTTPQNDTGHTTPQNDTGHTTPQIDTGHTTPQIDTGHTTPQNDTGHTTPQNDTGHTTPQKVTVHTTPQNDTGHTTPQNDTGHTTPQKVTVHTTPQNDTGHTTQQNGIGHTTPQNDTGHTTPQKVTVHTTPQNGTGHTTPKNYTGRTTSQKVPIHTTPQNDTGSSSSKNTAGSTKAGNSTAGTKKRTSVQLPTSPSATTFERPKLVGKDAKLTFTLVLNGSFKEGLQDKSSPEYKLYASYFTIQLTAKFFGVPGFKYVEINGFTNGSVHVNFSIVTDAAVVKSNEENVKKSLNETAGNWTGFSVNSSYGIVNVEATERAFQEQVHEVAQMLNNSCQLTANPCDISKDCLSGECRPKCRNKDCGGHGECYYDYANHTTACSCKPLYSGDECGQKEGVSKTDYDKVKSDYDKEKLLIIEIAGGAGGGVILFLLIVLVCVCVNLRKKGQKERDTEYPDEESLKRSDDLHAPYTSEGKSNPLFNGDTEGDRYVSTPRSSEDMGVPDTRGSTRREEMEMEEMNRYDKMNGLRKEPERNMVRREDGRVYHVINDEEIGNNTFLYRPPTRETEELSWSRAPNGYTDQGNMEVKKPSYFDRLSTDTEYKINRPRVNTRQTYYK